MIDSAAAVSACARAVIRPTHPRRTAKGSRAGGTAPFGGWRFDAAERVTRPPAGVVESVI
jgi:hypothetical protein